MLSKPAKFILGIAAFVYVAAALTIWLLMSFDLGSWATFIPLALTAVSLLVTRLMKRGKMRNDEA